MSIYRKLTELQNELKAPKGQRNTFGKYNYRSAEDILEAVKPLLLKHELSQVIDDAVELIGDRYYIKATITLTDTESGSQIVTSAFAREAEIKKGMDDSQVTGATSSYARKYALNGLYAIDDTKDADTDEYQVQTTKERSKPTNLQTKINEMFDLMTQAGFKAEEMKDFVNMQTGKSNSSELTLAEVKKIIELVKPMTQLGG